MTELPWMDMHSDFIVRSERSDEIRAFDCDTVGHIYGTSRGYSIEPKHRLTYSLERVVFVWLEINGECCPHLLD
ncbi:hypothetical protein BRC86_11420 [Halobacteriales archaeon QS_3_64_16]|nr:MAG: hypothetical protein BRC86_11420 [Halobacteriales archaeon QS_3_64_16]